MGLLKCVDCGHMVSDKASMCPQCGCPIEYIKCTYQDFEKRETDVLPIPQASTSQKRCMENEEREVILDGLLNDISEFWVFVPNNLYYGRGNIIECKMDYGPILKVRFEEAGTRSFGRAALGKSIFVEGDLNGVELKRLIALVNNYFKFAYNLRFEFIQSDEGNHIKKAKEITGKVGYRHIQADMLQQKDTAIATDKKEYIKKLTGARVLNYDDRHEAVIDRIEGTLVHVSGEKYWNQKPVYEFLGHFKFLSTEDERNFYKAFGSEINAHKAKIAEDERVRQSQSSRLDYSKLYGPSSFWEDEEQNTPDYDEDTDSGPDGVVETYEEYNSYD